MTFLSEILTKILHIRGIGRQTAYKIVSNIKDEKIVSDEGLVIKVVDLLSQLKISNISEIDVRDGFYKAEKVIEETLKNRVSTISIFDSEYPSKLRSIKDNPPILLHYKGDLSIINEPTCAVIGTREPTTYGLGIGMRIGELLAENDVVVVSGLAKGCDTAGHLGCLRRGGKTVAVLAHGLKHLYPKENRKLSEQIVDKGGLLITEYFYPQSARPNFFVDRDRIQAGLSDNIFVVQTGIKGGTMHTVQYALKNHRRVFTFKHPDQYLTDEKVLGNEKLIVDKIAIPIKDSQDIDSLLVSILYSSFQQFLDKERDEASFMNFKSTDFDINKRRELLAIYFSRKENSKRKRINQILLEYLDRTKLFESPDSEKSEINSQLPLWDQ